MRSDTRDTSQLHVPTGARTLVVENDAEALARHLLSSERRWPVVVVTTAHGVETPHIDATAIAEDLRGLAEVVAITSPDATWTLAAHLPPNTQVYGGATRVYPVDWEWQVRTRKAPMTLTHTPSESARSVEKVVSDAMSAALAAGLLDRPAATPNQVVVGKVGGLMPERALVLLPSGTMATLREELTGYDIPIDRLVRKGQHLSGRHDVESGRFDLEPRRIVAEHLPPSYTEGATVLARIGSVRHDGLMAELVPGIEINVPHDAVTGNHLDDVDALFAEGEIVAVRLTATEPFAVSFLDVDDDDVPLEAPAILDGGPPWLLPPPAWTEPGLRRPETAPTPAAPPAHLGIPDAEAAPVVTTPRVPAPPVPLPEQPTLQPLPGPRPTAPGAARPAAPRPGPGPHLVAGAATASAATAAAQPSTAPSKALRDAQLSLEAARAEVARLTGAASELAHVKVELAHVTEENHRLEQSLRSMRELYRTTDRKRQNLDRKLKSTGAVADRGTDSRPFFESVEDALRHDVLMAWVRTIPAFEKSRRPLPGWGIGPAFGGSLTQLGGVSWEKLCMVILEVVLQDPERLSAREEHALRAGAGVSTPVVTRADGATARRVYLQQKSASARRLHYWRLGSTIELSRVVLHDDFEP